MSAFTLYMSFEKRRQETKPLRNFSIRRAFRIVPMFFVATIIGMLFWRDIMGPAFHILLSLTFLNNFGPSTIIHGAPEAGPSPPEAVFYALLPFGFRYVRTARSAATLLASCEAYRVFALLFLIPRFDHTDFWLYFSFPANLAIFAMGVLLYFIWRDYLRNWTLEASKNWSIAAILLAGALYLEKPPGDVTQLISGSVPGLLLAAGLLLYPWKLFVNSFTTFFGRVSFSFYLLHFCVMHLMESFVLRNRDRVGLHSNAAQIVLIFIATLAINTPLAMLTWRYIEEPGIRVGRRLISALEHKEIIAPVAEHQF